jgi:hypothetical protein
MLIMKNLYFVIVLVFIACQNNKKFDLSKVEDKKGIGSTLSNLGVSSIQTQKGYWELVKKDERIEAKLNNSRSLSTIYSLKTEEDIKLFNFN